MVNESTVYVKRVSDGKYELLSKNLDLEQGSYSIQNIDGLWIMKKLAQTSMFKNSEIHTKGFFIFDDITQANKFAYSIREDIEKELVKGIRGFNNRFYFFSTKYYEELKGKILDFIDKDGTSPETLASKLGIAEEIVQGIIELMKEDGLVFERTKNNLFKI